MDRTCPWLIETYAVCLKWHFQEYIHRVGRTARGEGARGRALLFLIPEELGFLRYLKVSSADLIVAIFIVIVIWESGPTRLAFSWNGHNFEMPVDVYRVPRFRLMNTNFRQAKLQMFNLSWCVPRLQCVVLLSERHWTVALSSLKCPARSSWRPVLDQSWVRNSEKQSVADFGDELFWLYGYCDFFSRELIANCKPWLQVRLVSTQPCISLICARQ